MKPRGRLGRWRSPAAEQRVRLAEDEYWKEAFPNPPDALDIETGAGTTRVYRWTGGGNPVVLLHGMSGTSIMWYGFVDDLGGRTVYAVDTMGDAGRSVQRRPFSGVADMATWLSETIKGLELRRPHLVGNSYGAWLALNVEVHAPGTARSLSLLDPGGMARLSYRFFTWGGKVFAAAFLPTPLRLRAARRLRMPLLEDKRIMRLGLRVQIDHPFRLPMEVLTDEQLRSVAAPTLLLIGEKSEIYRAPKVLARAEATMPDLVAEILPGVGHALPVDPNADAATRVRTFLERVESR